MSEKDPHPVEIALHRKSRVLAIGFSDGQRFELPCEYLRVFSRAAEDVTAAVPVHGKEAVNIDRIEPQGQYAVRLFFDDGHDSGIYSWKTLHELGERQAENWAGYLARLAAAGIERHAVASGPATVKLLYFVHLPREFGRESETVKLPETVRDVRALLGWLRMRGKEWQEHLADDRVQVTVNRHFAEPFTAIADGDEIAFVPVSPLREGKRP